MHPTLMLDIRCVTLQDTWQRLLPGAVALLSLIPCSCPAQIAPPLDPVAVRNALVPRLNDGMFRGIATGWSDGSAIRAAAGGVLARHGAPVDTATRFELGEASAILTTALLANLVTRGDLSLDDLAQGFLPPSIHMPTRAGRAITLGDLAFHRSGLPDVRTTPETLARVLRTVGLRFDIGTRYAFSQLGIDILGLALARHLHTPLAGAIRSRVLTPLGITDMIPSSSRRVTSRDAVGHTAAGTPVTPQSTASGRWRASIIGATRFASAAGDTVNGPLSSTFALMMRARSPGPEPSLPVALGWRVLRLDGRDIYWLDAQDAPGFSAYIAIDPARQRAAAVLSNSSRAVDVIAGALLLGKVPEVQRARSASQHLARASQARRHSHRRHGRR
jgi:CubicO group peptidase (beta-lactamase class C family)